MEWTFTAPDGTATTVEAETEDEAWDVFQNHVKQQVLEEYQKKPWYQQAGIAADDVMRTGADALTFGVADRVASALPGSGDYAEEARKTAEARTRMTGADLPIDILSMWATGKAMPTAAPTVSKLIGGPAAVRAGTSGLVAGAETAALGAGEAAVRGDDVVGGAETGAIAGILGSSAAKLVERGVGAAKRFMGSGTPPKAVESPVPVKPNRRPTKAQKAAQAAAEARGESVTAFDDAITNAKRHAGGATSSGTDRALTSELETLLENKDISSRFTPDELAALNRIIKGDPAVRAGRQVGKLATPQSMVSSGFGGAGIGLAGNPVLGGILAGGVPTAGIAGRMVADKGALSLAKQASDMIHNVPPKKPGISSETQSNLYKTLRALGITLPDDDQ